MLNETEQDYASHKIENVYKKVKYLSHGYKQSEKFLRKDDVILITSKEEITSKWEEYFSRLLNCNEPDSLF